MNITRVLNSLGPHQDRQNGEPELSLNCLQRLSADGSLKKYFFQKPMHACVKRQIFYLELNDYLLFVY